jgi:hypothetical protein
MTSMQKHVAVNVRIARSIWGPLTKPDAAGLKELLQRFRFSVAQGGLTTSGQWLVRHSRWTVETRAAKAVRRHSGPIGASILQTRIKSLGFQSDGV